MSPGYGPETAELLQRVLDEVWDALPSERQATMLKLELAERILKCAAQGERDASRLRAAALACAS